MPDAATITFQAPAGEQRVGWDSLPDGLGAARSFESEELPLGAWQVEGAGFRITQRFSGEPVVRAILGKLVASGTLAMDLRTNIITLAPGQAINMQQQIEIAAL